MTRSMGKRRFHFKNMIPRDPAIQPFGEWPEANRAFHGRFREWLKKSSYSESALHIYSVAARMAIGYLGKPYWEIDPQADLERVRRWISRRNLRPSSVQSYRKGLLKLEEFVRLTCHLPKKPRELRWFEHIGALPPWLQTDIRNFIRFCQHAWKGERRFERSSDTLFTLSRPLRWMAGRFRMDQIGDLTPQLWYAWLDKRLADGISANTLNSELSALKHFVYSLQDLGRPVCERFLLLDRLEENKNLPKDIPAGDLRLLQKAIQKEMQSQKVGVRRQGCMDLAWFLLMLHSGLRTGEIRSLKLSDVEWEARRVRIEQSKGLKDRLVPLSEVTIQALHTYLEVRGPAEWLPENVFIYRHAPLSKTYCFQRLETYGRRSGVRASPHQLRHSCATLLLNSGAPVLAVQTILGHKQVDTTLGYARLYDGTVAADYYSAMNRVERQLALPEDQLAEPPSLGQLLALVDALRRDSLSPAQSEIVRSLREGLSTLAEKEMSVV